MRQRLMWAVMLGLVVAAGGCASDEGPVTAAGAAGPAGPAGERGPQGVAGPQGEPGGRLLYGDGSSGERVVSASAVLDTDELLFTNFTVAAGATLTIPSGTVIRCTGTFTNRGTIVVSPYAYGGMFNQLGVQGYPHVQPPHPGLAVSAPALGTTAASGARAHGSSGGLGVGAQRARALLNLGPLGGGGGAGRDSSRGGAGGGTLTVLAQGGLVNEGSIVANGDSSLFSPGAGGGGGGMLVLASRVRIANSGELHAAGGPGSPAWTQATNGIGGGGGGGGGLIHLVAPTLEQTGVLDVAGGAGGAVGGTLPATVPTRGGGGGGGASAGNGGEGGGVNAGAATVEGGVAGGAGVTLSRLLDPALVF